MSSKCITGKRTYADESLALEALVQHHIINEYPANQGPRNVYQCSDCLNWHFTSKGNASPLDDSDIRSRIKRERLANQWERRLK
ncbi:hypothetical protein [Ekhidna sp. To15]|uniref:hypothetical protein n=1 Tax=Ekhidna sp. To15 TaxID=3395267 RepID=UPI003F51D253